MSEMIYQLMRTPNQYGPTQNALYNQSMKNGYSRMKSLNH